MCARVINLFTHHFVRKNQSSRYDNSKNITLHIGIFSHKMLFIMRNIYKKDEVIPEEIWRYHKKPFLRYILSSREDDSENTVSGIMNCVAFIRCGTSWVRYIWSWYLIATIPHFSCNFNMEKHDYRVSDYR